MRYTKLKILQQCFVFFESLSKCCSYILQSTSLLIETLLGGNSIQFSHSLESCLTVCHLLLCLRMVFLFAALTVFFFLLCTDQDEKSLFVFDPPPPILKFCPVLNLGVQQFIL